jgi:tetratricopeptide (TPR) repeat protein
MIVDALPKAGLFAPATEKRYREGLKAYVLGDHATSLTAFEAVSAGDQRNVSDDLFAGMSALRLGDEAKAIGYLERVVRSDIGLPDQLMARYIPPTIFGLQLLVSITDRVTYRGPYDSLSAAMVLAELYQSTGRREEAIGLMQRMLEVTPGSTAVRLSLVDLLYEDDDFEGILEAAAGVVNDDDLTLAILHYRAKALANLGMLQPAVHELSACLRKSAGRDHAMLQEIRYNRAEAYELLGQPAKARADWERLYSQDPSYRDVRARVAERSDQAADASEEPHLLGDQGLEDPAR